MGELLTISEENQAVCHLSQPVLCPGSALDRLTLDSLVHYGFVTLWL